MSRRHYSSAQKQRFLERFAQSNESAAAFCRNQGLNYQTFLRWKRAAAKAPSQATPQGFATGFIDVALPAAPPSHAAELSVELDLGNGAILRVYSSPTTPTPPVR